MAHLSNVVPVGDRTFGQTVRALRLAKGIGLRELARRIGISSPYMTDIEQDDGPPPPEERVLALAHALDQDPDKLLVLAGRIASDVQDYVRDSDMVTFLRRARDKGLSGADLSRMVDQVEVEVSVTAESSEAE